MVVVFAGCYYRRKRVKTPEEFKEVGMKKRWLILVGLILVIVLASAGGCVYGQGTQVSPPSIAGYMGAPIITSGQQQVGLWVNGNGEAKAAPDIVLLSLGIEAEERTVASAQQEAAQTMDAVLKAIKANGVADKDIQTQRFSIQPVRTYNEDLQRSIITGYQVTNVVIAKIKQIDKAGTVIDAVAQAGGNLTRIDNIAFSIDDPTPYYNEARASAIQDAMATAKQMASTAGVKLGKLVYMSESTPYVPPVAMSNLFKAEGAAPTTPISPGELQIQVNIQMVYEIQ
jgi:uncharacterized protein YggE